MQNYNGTEIAPPDFGAVNYTIVVLYILAILCIAWFARSRSRDTSGFFVGNRRMNYIVVGISTFASNMSALTIMALPAVAFGEYNLFWTIQYPILLIPAFIVARYLIPIYRNAGVISIYEYFETRIHVSARMIGSASFIFLAIGRSGLILLMPALAFHIVTGVSLDATILTIGVVVTLYTMVGGITAVIWTDFLQACIMLLGAIVSMIVIISSTGLTQFFDIAEAHNKFQVIRAGFGISEEVTIWLVIFAIIEGVRAWGIQQDMTQRYLTTPSTSKAKASMWIAALGYIPFGYMFHFIGIGLFAYYIVLPDPTVEAMLQNNKADAIYPYFVATKFPPGLAGLVITSIFAGALSSIDSCMNSASAVCVEDFIKRVQRNKRSDRYYLMLARFMTVIFGVLITAVAFGFRNIQYAQVIWPLVLGVCTNGLVGLLGLVLWPKPVNKWGVIIGFAASYAVFFWCMFATDVNYLLWPIFGNAVCFLVGIAVSRIIDIATSNKYYYPDA